MSESADRLAFFSARRFPERARIREATIDLVLEQGLEGVTVEALCARAGVGRAAFEREFSDLADCCLQVYRANIGEFEAAVFGAYDGHASWRDGLRAAAYAAARWLRDHPREARFGEIQMRAGDAMAQVARDGCLQRIVELVDRGRDELEDPDSLGRSAAEGVIGSIYVFLLRELGEGGAGKDAQERVPELMYIAVRPYLGHEAAREELEIPPPPEPEDAP